MRFRYLLAAAPFIALAASAQPHATGRLEILVDLKANRAYIPLGTILPPGLEVRAGVRRSSSITADLPLTAEKSLDEQSQRESVAGGVPQPSTSILVFEYAPEARFEASRKYRRELETTRSLQLRPAPLTRDCYPITTTVEAEGIAGTYYEIFDSTGCSEIVSGYTIADDWTLYTYPQDETAAYIFDDRGHFSCSDTPYGYQSASCTTAYTGTIHFSPPFNRLHMIGFARHVEWMDDYVPNYVDFFFDMTFLETII